MQVAIARRALLNDKACGDQCDYWEHGPDWVLCMVDGLGHGEQAEAAALAALDYVAAHLNIPLQQLFKGCDAALRSTRGVAMSLVRVGPGGSLTYAGIGNTQARIWSPGQTGKQNLRLSSNYGIIGGGYRHLAPASARMGSQDLLILHTDGINDKFDPGVYDDELLNNLPALASRLLADWGRSYDDAAVMIARQNGV
ncbi:MAG: SpoIIE family protein phosphatase [Candidatus Sericytochromatia bacterium]